MFKFQSFTNVRPTKELGTQIITAPTKGQIKVTPDLADLLNVGEGDYVQIGGHDGKVYVVKGSKELGGGKLAAANKTGAGILTFSSAGAWAELNGDENFNIHYNVLTDSPIEDEDRTYYELVLDTKVEKTKRNSKAETIETTEEASGVVETPSTDAFESM